MMELFQESGEETNRRGRRFLCQLAPVLLPLSAGQARPWQGHAKNPPALRMLAQIHTESRPAEMLWASGVHDRLGLAGPVGLWPESLQSCHFVGTAVGFGMAGTGARCGIRHRT